MTCRHQPGDRSCSSHPDRQAEIAAEYQREREEQQRRERQNVIDSLPPTPDSERYEIVDCVRIGQHLVLKVLYPNCAKCAYEGNKVMVFLNVAEAVVIRWRKIDPHFRNPIKPAPREAPSPAARFPASPEGWSDALAYARSKDRSGK